ncbi:MAG TPA: universal stress protein, partial [Chthoniobacteraceae bacterium]|nr:universal stress protein [Chthoniobacteraceae bacterium]
MLLFGRLDFADCQVTMVHSVESVLPDGGFPGPESPHVVAQIIDEMEAAGEKALQASAASLSNCVVNTRSVMGSPLRNVLDIAKAESADLIVVGTQDRSAFEKAILGSVTRGLLSSSEHSFMVGKVYGTHEGPVTAVFATDHSDYCDRCAEMLIGWAPKGIEHLIVVSVFDSADDDQSLDADTAALVERFKPHFGSVTGMNRRGNVEAQLHEAVTEANAEVMIIGAQGRGFFDRLRSGS